MKTIDERFNLRGKIAAVVGGSGYLCSTLAQAMSESGMTVVVLDIAEKGPKVTSSSSALVYLRCDVTLKGALPLSHKRRVRRHCPDVSGQLLIRLTGLMST